MTFASRVSGIKKEAAMAPQAPSPSDVTLDLALAVIDSSTAPLLLLNGDLTLIAASKSFCRAFRIDPADISNRALSGLGAGEWNVPQLKVLLKATAAGYTQVEGYECTPSEPMRQNWGFS
jgi:hypothetical protein